MQICQVPKSARDVVAPAVRTLFAQGARDEVLAQHARTVSQPAMTFSEAATMRTDAGAETLAFADFPKQDRNWIGSKALGSASSLEHESEERADHQGAGASGTSFCARMRGGLVELQLIEQG